MKAIYYLNKSIEMVKDCLTDTQKFASIHPGINHIKDLGEKNYQVDYTLHFGIIPLSYTFHLNVDDNYIEHEIVMRVNVMEKHQIKIIYTFSTINNQTIVDETIHFKTKLLFKSQISKILNKQHKQLFHNLENIL